MNTVIIDTSIPTLIVIQITIQYGYFSYEI
jgi:hypothetical protein